VQHTATTWTKRSRGGPAAARRNAVPVAHPLPDALLAAAEPGAGAVTLHVHHVTCDEATDFAPASAYGTVAPLHHGVGPAPLRFEEHRMRLVVEESALRVLVVSWGGRRSGRPPAVRVRAGERLRWRYNDRLIGGCDGHWWYRLDTYHVTVGRVDVGTFLAAPTRAVDDLIWLR